MTNESEREWKVRTVITHIMMNVWSSHQPEKRNGIKSNKTKNNQITYTKREDFLPPTLNPMKVLDKMYVM